MSIDDLCQRVIPSKTGMPSEVTSQLNFNPLRQRGRRRLYRDPIPDFVECLARKPPLDQVPRNALR